MVAVLFVFGVVTSWVINRCRVGVVIAFFCSFFYSEFFGTTNTNGVDRTNGWMGFHGGVISVRGPLVWPVIALFCL